MGNESDVLVIARIFDEDAPKSMQLEIARVPLDKTYKIEGLLHACTIAEEFQGKASKHAKPDLSDWVKEEGFPFGLIEVPRKDCNDGIYQVGKCYNGPDRDKYFELLDKQKKN